ncbi:GerAB/ArcD/ProY family transporter [Paenibacillus sp. JX-17]|uniref:GerAB/ArcD/ProY family transporter n=1 Tax=Paenibacillus lacisoli TaxID=3064525 RepID=A0ABT9CFG9_9BACL|nr:GerAB/ArcD/ProY family transporter [Paenibacillus sp. JX-17]MDO7906431.1 GerAB/ArcD/ProY family transporter [Paenibacillus sp. JX-17]
MNRDKVSAGQMLSMMMLFEMGTALVVNIGIEARKDAWISIFIAMVGGAMLFFGYGTLAKWYPRDPLTVYARILLGRFLGTMVGVMYLIYFMYIAGRNVRDATNLIAISTLPHTPFLVISIFMILIVIYVLHHGIEVLARTALVFMAVMLGIGILSNSLLVASGSLELERILPVLQQGWGPIWRGVFQETLVFPFGEMICFTMLIPFMASPDKGRRLGILAIILSGLVLSDTTVMNIATLGYNIVEGSVFPLLTTIGKVQVSEFIQRLDVLVLMTLMIGAFFKISLFYCAALLAASDIFRIPYKKLLFPMGFIVLIWSFIMAESFVKHLQFGKLAILYVHPLFVYLFPFLLLIAGLLRRRRERRGRRNQA